MISVKLSAVLLSAYLVISNAQDTSSLRSLGIRGGGRGGGGGQGGGRGDGEGGRPGGGGRDKDKGKHLFSMVRGNCYWGANESQPLLNRLQDECDANDPCGEPGITSDIDCSNPTWDTMDGEDLLEIDDGCPEGGLTEDQKDDLKAKMQAKKEIWQAMSEAEREAYKGQMKALKETNAATVLQCGCCEGIDTVAALVSGREGAVAKVLGFRKPREDGDGRPGGFGGKPGGWSQHGSGMDIETMLEGTCPDFIDEGGCAKAEEEAGGTVNCDWFDSINVKRGRHHGAKLYCGCCRDSSDPTDPADPVDGGD